MHGLAERAIHSGAQFHVGVPELTSQAYTDAFQEVKAYGGDGVHTPTLRTPEQTTIGIFWAYDGSPGVGTPPRLYNQIVRVIAQQAAEDAAQQQMQLQAIQEALVPAPTYTGTQGSLQQYQWERP